MSLGLIPQLSCSSHSVSMCRANPHALKQVTSKHAPIPRQRSRLWHTAASLGEVDSLQNAVDAFKVRHGRLISDDERKTFCSCGALALK